MLNDDDYYYYADYDDDDNLARYRYICLLKSTAEQKLVVSVTNYIQKKMTPRNCSIKFIRIKNVSFPGHSAVYNIIS